MNEKHHDYFNDTNLHETLLHRLDSHDHDDVYNEIYNNYALGTKEEKSFLSTFVENLKPGLTVGLVNLPLSISLAVASGTNPMSGILSGIISGAITGFFGGSNYNIVGPTGALSGFLMACVIKYGVNCLPIFAILTGFLTFLTGYFKLEEYIDLVPVPVNEGFTLGVAFIIFFNQMNSALGIGKFKSLPSLAQSSLENLKNMTVTAGTSPNLHNNDELYDKVLKILDSGNNESLIHNIIQNLNHINQTNLESFIIYLFFLILFLYLIVNYGKIPWMIISAILGIFLSDYTEGRVDTLQSKFGILNFYFYDFSYLSDGNFFIKFFDIRIWIETLPIAFVAMLETLISAKIADSMTNTKFNKENELRSLGISNLLTGIFGGIPVTAALARTSLNIKSGCTNKISSLVSSVLMFVIGFFFMNYFSFIPMPVIAAQVCIVAVRLVNFSEIQHLYKHEKKDFYLFVIIVIISVVRDSIEAVLFGMLIYQIIFCKQLTKPWTEIIKAKNITGGNFSKKGSIICPDSPRKHRNLKGSLNFIGNNVEEYFSNSPMKKKSFINHNLEKIEEEIPEFKLEEDKTLIDSIKNKIKDVEKATEKKKDQRDPKNQAIDPVENQENINQKVKSYKPDMKINIDRKDQRETSIGNENQQTNYFMNGHNFTMGNYQSEASILSKNLINTFEDINDNNFFDIPKEMGNYIIYRIIGILNFMNVETHIHNINKLNLDPDSKIIISLRYVHLIDTEAIKSLENIIKSVSNNKEKNFFVMDIKILISGITKSKMSLLRNNDFIQDLMNKNAVLLANENTITK